MQAYQFPTTVPGHSTVNVSNPAIVAPAYPECLYTKTPRYHAEWSFTQDGVKYGHRATFATKADAVEFCHAQGYPTQVS